RAKNAAAPRALALREKRLQPHARFDAALNVDNLQAIDIVRRLDDILGQAEADGEVAQIQRGCHHHGVGRPIIGERDRHLLRDRPVRLEVFGAAPDNRRGIHVSLKGHYSAATIFAAMRRLRSDSSSYCSCHSVGPFDGETWTAVTLYSGQLVAQSE